MKQELQKAVLKLTTAATANSPTILTAVSVAGLVTTTVLAVKATPKALRLLDLEPPNLTKKEVIKTTWKCYIPTVAMGGLTIGCIICANSINLRRNAALASVYSLAETSLKEYQAKVVETFGENKAQKVKDDVAKDLIKNNPVKDQEVIITGNGETLCYDSFSGRYFKSNMDKINKAENAINKALLNENFISLNEVYYELGLPNNKVGDEVGWTNYDDGSVNFHFSSQLSEDGTPCLVIDFQIGPRYDYLDKA